MKQIQKEKYDTLHIVLGVVNDKDLDEVSPFPCQCQVLFLQTRHTSRTGSCSLQEKAQKFNLKGNTYHSVTEAYDTSRNIATKNDFIFVGGSTFVVAELPLNTVI